MTDIVQPAEVAAALGAEATLRPAPRRRTPRRRRETLAGWGFALPALLLIVLFVITPLVSAFVISLTNERLVSGNDTEWVGVDNFTRLLEVRYLTLDPVVDESTGDVTRDENGDVVYPAVREFTRNNPDHPDLDGLQEWFRFGVGDTQYVVLAGDAVFMKSLVNTLIFAIVIVPLQSGFALVLALLINKRTRGVNIFRTMYFVPVVSSMVVISLLWRFIYAPGDGLLNNMLGGLTFGILEPRDWLGSTGTALPAVMLMSIWQAVGFHMIIWLTGLQTIPGELYEAASLDGVGRWQQFRFVTWPGLRHTAVFILITITIAAFGLFTQIDVMTQGGPRDSTSTVVFQAVDQGFRRQDIAYGSAISVVFFFMVLVVALIQRFLTREKY